MSMAAPDMRASKSRQEHLENIGFVFVDESNAFVWQNLKGTKLVAPIVIKRILLERNHVILSPLEGIFPDFEQDKDLYFKADHKDMVFKSSPPEHQISPKEIHLTFPEKIFYLEQRKENRLDANPKKETLIHLRPVLTKQEGKILECRVRNLSENGMGIVVSPEDQEYFSSGSLFKIINFDEVDLEESVTAQTTYNHTVTLSNTPICIIGLKFKSEFPKEILSTFQHGS